MPLWGNTDANTAVPRSVLGQLNRSQDNTTAQLLVHNNVTENAFVTGKTTGVFAVDANEFAAARANSQATPAHAGWNLRTVGRGGRAGRVHYETLVAMGSMSSDSEDSVFRDYTIIIDTQPQNSAQNRGNAVNFIVVARSVPAGATLSYRWEQDGGNGSQTWANVANTGVFASANGNTSATLSISNNFTVAGNTFRVRISNTHVGVKYSANAVISYV